MGANPFCFIITIFCTFNLYAKCPSIETHEDADLKQFTNCSQKEGRELARELKESYSSILLSIDNQIHKIQHLEKELYNNRARLDYLMKVSINTTPLDVQILNHIYV